MQTLISKRVFCSSRGSEFACAGIAGVFAMLLSTSMLWAYTNNNGPDVGNQDDVPTPLICPDDPTSSTASNTTRRSLVSEGGNQAPKPIPGRPGVGYTGPRKSKYPINFLRGSAVENATDVALPGPFQGWSHSRSYDSRLVVTGGTELAGMNGLRWEGDALGPYLWHPTNSPDVYLMTSASTVRVFSGSSYTPPADYDATLTLHDVDSSDEMFELIENRTGLIYRFYGWSSSIAAKNRGRLKELTNRSYVANATGGVIYGYNSNGNVDAVQLPQGWYVLYSYVSTGTELGRLASVSVLDGSFNTIRSVAYTYYGTATSPNSAVGNTGDLLQVKVTSLSSDGSTSMVYTTQYRYYKSGDSNGSPHQLKMVLEPDDIERLTSAGNTAVDTPEEIMSQADTYTVTGSNTVGSYASRSFTYYMADATTTIIATPWSGVSTENLNSLYGGSEADEYDSTDGYGRVKTETVNGDFNGCCSGSTNGLTNSYFYLDLNDGSSSDANKVTHLVVEDTEDITGTAVTRTIYGLNTQGVELRKAIIADPTSGTLTAWCESIKLHATTSRVTQQRMPSAHTGMVTSNATMAQFLDPTTNTNDTATVQASSGLVYDTEYAVDDSGNLTSVAIKAKEGTGVTGNYISYTKYGDGTNDKPTWAVIEERAYDTKVSSSPSTNGIATSYAYTFYDTADTQLQQKTTTLPAISTGENGSSTATSTYEYYDQLGRLRWTKDGEGYVHYYSYQPSTGGLAYQMIDVNTSSLAGDITSGSAGKWDAWSGSAPLTRTPSGSPTALQLVTKTEYDAQGRETLQTDPAGELRYTFYETTNNRVAVYHHWKSTASERLVPIEVTERNDGGEISVTFHLDPDAGSATPGNLSTPSQSYYTDWVQIGRDALTGRVTQRDVYHDIPSSGTGTLSTNFSRTIYQYDSLGRTQYEIAIANGTATSNSKEQVKKYTYDVLNRVMQISAGVSGDSAANSHDMGSSYTSYPTLRTLQAITYDENGVGDGHVTKQKNYFSTGANDYTGVNYKRDFRGSLRGEEPFHMVSSTETTIGPFVVHDVDWRGAELAQASFTSAPTWATVLANDIYANSDTYKASRETLLTRAIDDLGGVYQERKYAVHAGATATNYVQTDHYYDRNGRRVATAAASLAAVEQAYDGAGRLYEKRTVSQLQTTKYSSGAFQYRAPVPTPAVGSLSGGDNYVFTLEHQTIDSMGNVTELHSYEMVHTDTTGIDLTNHDDYVRRSEFQWFDNANRLTAKGDYGSGDTAAGAGVWKYTTRPTRSASAPTASSDSVRLTTFTYNVDTGRLETEKHWSASSTTHVTKKYFDDAGRTTYVAQNYVNFTPPSTNTGDGSDKSKDQVVGYEYDGLNNLTKLTAKDQNGDGSGTDDESTVYFFEDAVAARFQTNVIYPDSSDTTSSGTDQVKKTFNLDGGLNTQTDQRGRVLTYTYNGRRHVELQKVTTLGTGTDSSIQSIKHEYDTLGRSSKLTSYSASDGTGTARNQIQYTYDDLGRVLTSAQSHEGVVSGSPTVTYGYDSTIVSNVYTLASRPTQITHPNGRVTFWGYNSTTADSLHNRLSLVREVRKTSSSGTQYAVYDNNGSGRSAIVDYPAPDVKLDYYQGTPLSYAGYNRYGEITDQYWDGYNSTADVSRVQHGYDYAGSRLWREDVVAAANSKNHDEYYTHDGLHRTKNFDRGDLNAGKTAISGTPGNEQDWTLDAWGNWTALTEKTSGSSTLVQSRTHNKANELSTIGVIVTGTNWADGVLDAAGNMTTVPDPTNLAAGMTLVYDAWNRLVKVSDASANILGEYEYDGLNRRIVKIDRKANPDVTFDYYYNEDWQVLEVRKDSNTTPLEEFVWHPYYVDALAVRNYDADTSGAGVAVEHYFMQDANTNVVAATTSTGSVAERYQYTPYGAVSFLNSTFGAGGSTSSIANSVLYTGRQFDPETKLYHYRNRYYEAELGRFASRDPIVYHGSRWNLYQYALDSPTSLTDPLGLEVLAVGAGSGYLLGLPTGAGAGGLGAAAAGAGTGVAIVGAGYGGYQVGTKLDELGYNPFTPLLEGVVGAYCAVGAYFAYGPLDEALDNLADQIEWIELARQHLERLRAALEEAVKAKLDAMGNGDIESQERLTDLIDSIKDQIKNLEESMSRRLDTILELKAKIRSLRGK